MSNWKKHLIIGLIISIIGVLLLTAITKSVLSMKQYFYLLIVLLVSPLLPDLDHNNSLLRKILLAITTTSLTISLVISNYWLQQLKVINIPLSVLTTIIVWFPIIFKHRGFTHSITATIIYVGLVFLMTNWITALVALLGYYSHLILDGVPYKII